MQALMEAVAVGPVSVVFNVVDDAFYWYAGGIYQGGAICEPTATAINHAMTAVGYVWTGTKSTSYW